MLKCRAASRWLMPSAQASRTFRYKYTVKILPPSLSPERVKVDDFYTARSKLIPPLPWPTFASPFSLHDGFGKYRRYRIGKALETINDCQHDILGAPVFKLVHDAEPEFGTLILFNPQAENLFAAISADAKRDMNSFAANHAFIADLDANGVEKHQWIGRIKRPLLPGSNFFQRCASSRAPGTARCSPSVIAHLRP